MQNYRITYLWRKKEKEQTNKKQNKEKSSVGTYLELIPFQILCVL